MDPKAADAVVVQLSRNLWPDGSRQHQLRRGTDVRHRDHGRRLDGDVY